VKPRLIIILLVIVIAPLGFLAWLGLRTARNEQAVVQVRFRDLLQGKLGDLSRSIDRLMASREREIERITRLSGLDPDTIRDTVKRERLIRQIFVLDARGSLIHPPPVGLASRAEEEFLARTRRIFGSKDPFARPTDTAGGKEAEHGWYAWYWDEGVNLLYWRRDDEGRMVGAELDRMALLSDMVAELPETNPKTSRPEDGRIDLIDTNGKAVYGWGAYEPGKGEKPVASIPLHEPLGAWRLEYFMPQEDMTGAFSKSALFSLLLSLAALALVIAGLAFYLVREGGREIREARQRVTFVNQVSHELKTPLTNIRMYAELLEENLDEADGKNRGYLNVIVSESQRLSRLILNVLTFGRKEQSRLVLRPAPCVVDDILLRIIDQFRPGLEAKGVDIVFNRGASERVMVDADALGQILGNLLSNVEKYAASGKLLNVSSRTQGDHTTIMVEDRGPGIPDAAGDKVFRPFVRLSNAITEGASGTGIGLAIARDLARLHGGDVTLEPAEKGARFKVVLATPKNQTAPGQAHGGSGT